MISQHNFIGFKNHFLIAFKLLSLSLYAAISIGSYKDFAETQIKFG